MNGLLKTLIKPDWDENSKRSLVIEAANLVQVGEFQLIQLAYKTWYNEELPENKINNIFNEYMLTDIIPIWVTAYANDILKLEKVGVLDGNKKKYHVYDNEFGEFIYDEKDRRKRGIFYALIIAFVFIGGHYIAIKFSGESASFYPPYIEKKVVYPELYNESKD
ncbi:MAG TPA: hypothetical protein EYQ38_02435 [Candidatus Pelagibacter sp.]|jgi:hypothetical protein|nr:hypothetical protein [Candidatus Pelagibacter sp.]